MTDRLSSKSAGFRLLVDCSDSRVVNDWSVILLSSVWIVLIGCSSQGLAFSLASFKWLNLVLITCCLGQISEWCF